jgi:hypothetical protein
MNPSPIYRLPAAPAGANYPGWQCWAVVAMFNSYLSLPYAVDLLALRNHVLQHPKYRFSANYERGISQSLAIKAKSRLTPEESLTVQHPYFTVLDSKANTPTPHYHLTTDSIAHLRVIEQLGMKLTGTRTTGNTKVKAHLGTLLTYETKRTFMSAPGLEVERLYREFCELMTEYYATSSPEEKAGLTSGKASRRMKAAAATKLITPTTSVQTAVPTLSEKMAAMRFKIRSLSPA